MTTKCNVYDLLFLSLSRVDTCLIDLLIVFYLTGFIWGQRSEFLHIFFYLYGGIGGNWGYFSFPNPLNRINLQNYKTMQVESGIIETLYKVFKVKSNGDLESMGYYCGATKQEAINKMAECGGLSGRDWSQYYIAIPNGLHFQYYSPQTARQ